MSDVRTASALPPLALPKTPWRLLFRAPGAASDPRCVILAAIGYAACRGGWTALASIFGEAAWRPIAPGPTPFPGLAGVGGWLLDMAAPLGDLLGPVATFFRADVPAAVRVEAVLALLWMLVVWSLFGGAIARVAAVRVASGGRIGLLSALGFAAKRFASMISAPIVPMLVILLIAAPAMLIGLLNRIPGDFGRSIASFLSFIPLLLGVASAVILVGLALAWPMMIATVMVDGEDFFDAISRSYSYVRQRTALYAGLLLLAAGLGAVGATLFAIFAQVAMGMADWSVSMGAPSGVGFRFLEVGAAQGSAGATARVFWSGVVGAIVGAWVFSYLWTAASIFYLILRRNIDGSETHDIYHPAQEDEPFVPDEPAAAAAS